MIIRSQSRVRGYGYIPPFITGIACPELYAVINKIEFQLKVAVKLGLSEMSVFKAAQDFYDRETGFVSASEPWGSTKCNTITSEAMLVLRDLDALITMNGGKPSGDAYPDAGTGLPWYAYAAGGVVALGVVGYFLNAAGAFLPTRRR